MGLSSTLGIALTGLNATQAGIDVVSRNVANAGTPGYVRRDTSTTETIGATGIATSATTVQRLLDRIVQHQLFQQNSAAAATSTASKSLTDLAKLFGAPGSANSLDSLYSGFTGALQALQNDPSSYQMRTGAIDAATALASQLNSVSDGIQQLRTQAEAGIANGVTRVNELLDALTKVNTQVLGAGNKGNSADLKDQRDRIVSELSQYVDIRVSEDSLGSLTVATPSGLQLFDGKAAFRFDFDRRGGLDPNSSWSSDPAKRSVGSITMTDAFGNVSDAIAKGFFRGGEIGANIELRDKTLVQAQAQIDEIAAQMSRALSDRDVAGTAASAGAASGFSVDMSGLQAGNTITLDYKTTPGGATQRFTFVRVDSAASLPLPASAGGDAGNRVIGIDFSGGSASVAAQIQAAVGTGFSVSAAGSSLTILDDGAAGTRDVAALSAHPTATSLASAGGSAALPFFTDASGRPFTGAYANGVSQTVGFAARIQVNPALIADRSALVVYSTSPATAQGDTTRPQFLLDRLGDSQRAVTNAMGLDGSQASFSTSVSNLVQRVVNSQAQAAEQAQRLDEGQQIALATVQSRFEETSKVTVDREMANLIELQSAYAANARIISTVKEMMDVLLRI